MPEPKGRARRPTRPNRSPRSALWKTAGRAGIEPRGDRGRKAAERSGSPQGAPASSPAGSGSRKDRGALQRAAGPKFR
jgi:hypothetical protein